MHRFVMLTLLLVGLFFALSGCSKNLPPASSPLESPPITPVTFPTPDTSSLEPFRLDKPIIAGATRVTGSGPVGVPIMLLDITFGGRLLALGVIDQDGRFELGLGEPLEARHRIGITLGDLTGTGWQPGDFSDRKFNGDEALNVPQIGFFFDTCMIHER